MRLFGKPQPGSGPSGTPQSLSILASSGPSNWLVSFEWGQPQGFDVWGMLLRFYCTALSPCIVQSQTVRPTLHSQDMSAWAAEIRQSRNSQTKSLFCLSALRCLGPMANYKVAYRVGMTAAVSGIRVQAAYIISTTLTMLSKAPPPDRPPATRRRSASDSVALRSA